MLKKLIGNKKSRQHQPFRKNQTHRKHIAAGILASCVMAFSGHSMATPTVSGQTISWPDDGWYQVQIQGDFDSDVCQGGRSCDVDSGTYLVINHTTEERFYDIVVSAGPSEPPVVIGNTISWQDNGWYQVQVQGDFDSDVCQGGTSCEVEPGTYLVINLTTEERFYDVVVTGDADEALPTMFETLEASGFGALLNAIEIAGLTSFFMDENVDVTLFAPTNDAIALLDAETLDALQADNDALIDFLAYHVIFEPIDAETAVSLAPSDVLAANGDLLALNVVDGNLFVNESQVTVADVLASNGIIHVIDSVLIPPADDDDTSQAPPNPVGTILEVADAAGEFTLLLEAISAAGLSDTLGNPNDNYTVFAPTDAAINAVGQEAIDGLVNDPEALRDFLEFHLIPGTVFQAADFVEILGFDIAAANGGILNVTATGEGLAINGVNIVIADIPASNGVIHVIDMVLTP